MKEQLWIALKMTLVMTVLTGLIYPLAVTGVAQVFFPKAANGSRLRRGGEWVGSRLIGQSWKGPEWFHGRPSAHNYNGLASGGSNYGPSNQQWVAAVTRRAGRWRRVTGQTRPVPADLVEASASGLDPDISPAAAAYQAARVARARHLPLARVQALIRRFTRGRTFGFLGAPRVNVLELNLALLRQR